MHWSRFTSPTSPQTVVSMGNSPPTNRFFGRHGAPLPRRNRAPFPLRGFGLRASRSMDPMPQAARATGEGSTSSRRPRRPCQARDRQRRRPSSAGRRPPSADLCFLCFFWWGGKMRSGGKGTQMFFPWLGILSPVCAVEDKCSQSGES